MADLRHWAFGILPGWVRPALRKIIRLTGITTSSPLLASINMQRPSLASLGVQMPTLGPIEYRAASLSTETLRSPALTNIRVIG